MGKKCYRKKHYKGFLFFCSVRLRSPQTSFFVRGSSFPFRGCASQQRNHRPTQPLEPPSTPACGQGTRNLVRQHVPQDTAALGWRFF